MKRKTKIDKLRDGVKSLLVKNGYAFSEEDKALLEEILEELEDLSKREDGVDPNEVLKYISLLLRFLKFFGIEDFTGLF
ncbi:MAG: hypothetical protein AAF717_02655 [Bacteroidota bacterium]